MPFADTVSGYLRQADVDCCFNQYRLPEHLSTHRSVISTRPTAQCLLHRHCAMHSTRLGSQIMVSSRSWTSSGGNTPRLSSQYAHRLGTCLLTVLDRLRLSPPVQLQPVCRPASDLSDLATLQIAGPPTIWIHRCHLLWPFHQYLVQDVRNALAS